MWWRWPLELDPIGSIQYRRCDRWESSNQMKCEKLTLFLLIFFVLVSSFTLSLLFSSLLIFQFSFWRFLFTTSFYVRLGRIHFGSGSLFASLRSVSDFCLCGVLFCRVAVVVCFSFERHHHLSSPVNWFLTHTHTHTWKPLKININAQFYLTVFDAVCICNNAIAVFIVVLISSYYTLLSIWYCILLGMGRMT